MIHNDFYIGHLTMGTEYTPYSFFVCIEGQISYIYIHSSNYSIIRCCVKKQVGSTACKPTLAL